MASGCVLKEAYNSVGIALPICSEYVVIGAADTDIFASSGLARTGREVTPLNFWMEINSKMNVAK